MNYTQQKNELYAAKHLPLGRKINPEKMLSPFTAEPLPENKQSISRLASTHQYSDSCESH